MKEKEKREDVDEVAWLTKGLEGGGLEVGWGTRLLNKLGSRTMSMIIAALPVHNEDKFISQGGDGCEKACG